MILKTIDIVEAAIENVVVQMIEQNTFSGELEERLGNLLSLRRVLMQADPVDSPPPMIPFIQPWPEDLPYQIDPPGSITFNIDDITKLMNHFEAGQ